MTATVNSGTQRLNVRAGPGTTYGVVGSLTSGNRVTATARNAAGDWLRIAAANLPGGAGWVSAAYLTVQGSAADLPVAADVQPATSAPRPAASTAQPVAGLTGKLVFQERSGGAIYLYDLARGALRTLTTGADPALSPDGRTVAFWRAEDGGHSLYLIDSDGSHERRILARGEALRAPAWSPDGGKIVFSHISGQRKCRDVGYNICMPDVFPYNLMFPLKVADAWGLARVDRDGGSYQDIASVPDAVSPDWSDRGILYSGVGIQLTQDGPDADQNRGLIDEYRYQDPASQPGGGRIVFHSLEKDHWEIFSANADGTGVVALTRPETILVDVLPHNVAPDWSPDGRHIVFLSNRSGRWQLWVMDAGGENQRALPIDAPIEYNYQAEQVVSWGR
ncbi:MAG: translocation protein TolB [Chloroflexi bacterium ADurb.Bin325]|nr:MAG: translocation protein TolB [Chloroflexi bacterium ADurb.Bin325]